MHVGKHVQRNLKSLLLAPFVLLADLLLLAGREIVLDVEGLPDLLRGLALDEVGHSLAGYVQQSLDVEIVSGQNELEEGSLVSLQELRVPRRDVVGALLLVLIVLGQGRVVLVVGGPLDHLLENGSVHVGQRHFFIVLLLHTQVLEHGLNGDALLGNFDVHREDLSVTGAQLDTRHF